MSTSVSPRLFVIMAARAPVAVIVKRGPNRWTQLVLWDTRNDVLTEGAWLYGRIYAEKCDLSPDGELFVYAAFQGTRLETTYTQSYTAVSRPPWLHALTLWPVGTTYGGGGRFVGDRRLALRSSRSAHPQHPPTGLEIVDGVCEKHRSTGEVSGAEWSGRDQSGRLAYASNGRLFVRTGGEGAVDVDVEDVEVASFAMQEPEPRPPPEWATRPLPVVRPRRDRRARKS